MSSEFIRIRGAREHNLKNVDLDLPREKLIVITGLSGSGKSSLAFDTLYAEGQRRYVESLSAYARQFLGLMEKPNVDLIEGLSPAISIDQKGSSRNPRSTVGTVTEIYDYLRLLFARVGQPHCPGCGQKIESQTVDQMVDRLLSLEEDARLMLLAPLVRGRKGEYRKLFRQVCESGFTRVRVNGEIRRVDEEEITLERYRQHTIEAVVDRLVVRPGIRSRLADSLETALALSGGTVLAVEIDAEREHLFSQHLACVDCNLSFEELAPRLFSFNSPYGACPTCMGLGFLPELDPALVIPDPQLSVSEGAIAPWGKPVFSMRHHPRSSGFWRRVGRAARSHRIDLDRAWSDLAEQARQLLLFGDGDAFEGALPTLQRLYTETESEYFRGEIEKYMSDRPCPACHGARLKPEALAVRLADRNIGDFTRLPVREALAWIERLELTERQRTIAHQVVKEIRERLAFLDNVGLDYLTLDRAARTLSGGEAQRIRLATQIGSGLVGVLYILDEPSIGLHQRDNARLLKTLSDLRSLGNTLLVVEHDEETIRTADYVVDIGPGAGIHGGEVVARGTPSEVARVKESITGKYLSGELSIPVPARRRQPDGRWLEVCGARQNNLQDIDVAFPISLFTCVTGVSGSGKSTLVNEILQRALAMALRSSQERPGEHRELRGLEHVDKVIVIDQNPIGRTPRSNPATYTGIFDPIRRVFAQAPEARMRGYAPGRFSFNVRGGRCEACQGQGILKIEMHFLPDVYVPCEVCKGKRYNRETLEVRFKGKSIADVLEMTVEEVLELFQNIPRIARRLQTIVDVGLGYVHLGQPATTLSGGEAQRVKLATELSKVATGRTVYVLDEPTTGLHFHDVARLLEVLQRLVDAGNTVVIIEHNLDVIKSADWIVDLGPEGGHRGGKVIASGSPEDVTAVPESHTGHFLKPLLGTGATRPKSNGRSNGKPPARKRKPAAR
ncbi:MAG: excinuclease ABC subunit UvrA [Armatimonadetes bacterium]|nr:excinuclease ABC subunit UvrA [Armatimonadota bacterium]